jgi:hypothetical protein
MKRHVKNIFLYLFFKFSEVINYFFPKTIELYDPKIPAKNILSSTQSSGLTPYVKQNEYVTDFKKYVNAQVARLGGTIEWVDPIPGICLYKTRFNNEESENEFINIIEDINQNGLPKIPKTPEKKSIDPDIEDLLSGISNQNPT